MFGPSVIACKPRLTPPLRCVFRILVLQKSTIKATGVAQAFWILKTKWGCLALIMQRPLCLCLIPNSMLLSREVVLAYKP